MSARRVSDASWDWRLWGAAAALGLISAVAMSSAAVTVSPTLASRHGLWILIGCGMSLAVARTNYRQWLDAAPVLFGLSVAALGLVELVGPTRLGAQRWLSFFGFSLQPSELAKLSTILLLSRALAGQPSPLPSRAFWGSLLIMGVPAVLIFLQPDLGSASILGAIWLGMAWVAGASRRDLGTLAVALVILAPIGWHVLKDYQRDRLMVFLDPQADPLGAGYTIIQSTIAIGSGRLLGRGWRAGTQNQLSFLPEHHSDFIFSVVGEEWGFFGCLLTIAAFAVLLARIGRLVLDVADPQGRLLAAGIMAWIGYQAFVNMGMVMGVLPVVGVPLPLISYGGSSMVVLWLGLGLLQSVRRIALQ